MPVCLSISVSVFIAFSFSSDFSIFVDIFVLFLRFVLYVRLWNCCGSWFAHATNWYHHFTLFVQRHCCCVPFNLFALCEMRILFETGIVFAHVLRYQLIKRENCVGDFLSTIKCEIRLHLAVCWKIASLCNYHVSNKWVRGVDAIRKKFKHADSAFHQFKFSFLIESNVDSADCGISSLFHTSSSPSVQTHKIVFCVFEARKSRVTLVRLFLLFRLLLSIVENAFFFLITSNNDIEWHWRNGRFSCYWAMLLLASSINEYWNKETNDR